MNFIEYMINFIKGYDSPEQAFKAVYDTAAPYKYRRARKLMLKAIRTYIYHTGQS